MRKYQMTWRAVVSWLLVALLVITHMPVFGNNPADDSDSMAINAEVKTASLPDDPGNPVDVSLSVPAVFDTVSSLELSVDLSLTVNTSGVTGFDITIPLKSPGGTQYFDFDLMLDGNLLPEPVASITYTDSALTIHMRDDLPTGIYNQINFVFPFVTAFGGITNGTVLWDSAGVTVSTSSPAFGANLLSATVLAGDPNEIPLPDAEANNVLTGLWQETGTTDIEDVYVTDINKTETTKTINYVAVLDGTDDVKTLEITIPSGLVFNTTKAEAPTSQQIPGIIDDQTSWRNSTATSEGKLKLFFDKSATGLVRFDIIVKVSANYSHSNQIKEIKNSLTVGSTLNTTETTMRLHDYTTQTVYLDPVPGIPPNDIQTFIYSNFPTIFSLVDGYSDETYFTSTGNLKTCTVAYDLSKYMAVQDTAGGAFRPLAKNEVTIVNGITYFFAVFFYKFQF